MLWNRFSGAMRGRWGLGITALVLAVLVAEHLALGRSLIDAPLRGAFRTSRAAWLDVLMGAASWLGRGEVLCLIVVGCAVVAWRRGERNAVGFLIGAGAGAAMLTVALKLLFARERPELLERLVPAGGYSFPSGHSLGSMAVLGAVVRWVRLGGGGWQRSLIGVAMALIVVVVGASRVYLGVHYPSDVVAGWAIGLLWVALLELMMLRHRVSE